MPLSFLGCRVFADPIALGSPLPEVEVTLDTGETKKLTEIMREGFGVVYFYPRSFTPGCTAQGCSIRDSWGELSELGVLVLGVSSDSVDRQRRFRAEQEFPFPLVADTEGEVAKAFGSRSLSRQAYLFKDGVLVWRDLSASTSKQAEDILNAITALDD